ncbi:MAG: hypothetical protein E7K00_15945 [Clostridium perfringens]|nr:hypothetical protein [Clostridium perfringens]
MFNAKKFADEFMKEVEEKIEQLKFIGAKPVKESSRYCYFEFPGDMKTTQNMLGIY